MPCQYWLLAPVGSWCASLCPVSVGLTSEPAFQDPVATHGPNARMPVPGGTLETITAHILLLQTRLPERRSFCPRSHSILGNTMSLLTPCHSSFHHVTLPPYVTLTNFSLSLFSLVFVFFLCLPHLKFTHPDLVIP